MPLSRVDFGASAVTGETLDLDLLIRFFRNPAAELLQLRTGLRSSDWSTQLPETLIDSPDPRFTWRVGDLILRDLLAGVSPADARAHALRIPQLPPGRFGTAIVDGACGDAALIARAWADQGFAPSPRNIDIQIAGRHLVGHVDVDGAVLPINRFGWFRAQYLVDAWIRLLALSASGTVAATPIAALIGKGAQIGLSAPPPSVAREMLGQLVTLRESGLRHLVPLPPQTAYEHVRDATSLRTGSNSTKARFAAARTAWDGRWGEDSGESFDTAWLRFFPDRAFESVLALPPLPSDPGVAAASRFEQLAAWFWEPILTARMTAKTLRSALGEVRR